MSNGSRVKNSMSILIHKYILDYLVWINAFDYYAVEKEGFIEFANSMIKTSTFALANNKKIVSQGD